MRADRDLGRLLGLHPIAALLAVAADWAFFGSNVLGPGIGLVLALLLSLPVAIVLFLLQKLSYGDATGAAAAKALGVTALICVPTPVFSAPVVLSGVAGAMALRRGVEGRP